MAIIKGKCPCCKENASFNTDYSMVKAGFHVAKGLFGFSKKAIAKNVAKNAAGIAFASKATNMQCLECDSLVHQCNECNTIMKFFNTGHCKGCGAWIS